jgi:phosphoribosylglycinamide formyltransferase-1
MSLDSISSELSGGGFDEQAESGLRIGWLSTGRGPGSRRLLESTVTAIRHGDLGASIDYVFCTRDPGEAEGSDTFLKLVAEYEIPSLTLSFRAFRDAHTAHDARNPDWRRTYNAELLKLLVDRPVDILVLAGFLLILDEEVITAFPTLNLHPAAPGGPVGTWQEVIRTQIAEQATESGAMTQLATPAVDRGPVASFCRFPIRGPTLDPLWSSFPQASEPRSNEEIEASPLFAAIRAESVRREVPLLIATLNAVATAEIRLQGGRVIDGLGQPSAGLDLTDEIEWELGRSP